MQFLKKKPDWFKYLTQHYFAFGRPDQAAYTQSLYFKQDGQIHFGVAESPNESFWRLTETQLLIENDQHEVTTAFALPEQHSDKLLGQFVADEQIQHQLQVVSSITAVDELMTFQRENLIDSSNQLSQQINDNLRQNPLTTKHQKLRVVFVLNAVETLDASVPLLKALIEHERFEVRVLTFNRIFRGVEQTETKALLDQKLAQLGINVVLTSGDAQIDTARLKDWAPDFLFRQSEWDQDFPAEVAVRNLFWTRVMHLSYVITENFVYNPNSELPFFMLDYYEKIWRYFVSNPLTEKERDLLAKTFISEDVFEPVGSLKAVQIKNTVPQWPVETTKQKVIWMPHHSIGNEWFAFGTFDENYQAIYDWTVAHPDISVVLNPHPSLPAVIEAGTGALSKEDFDAFLVKWNQLPNTNYLIREGSYPAVAASDVILSDGISVLYEAQILNKPIVYIENPAHVAFTEYGEQLARGIHRETKIDEALTEVEKLLAAPDDLAPFQIENTKPWLENEHPEQNIIDRMLSEFA